MGERIGRRCREESTPEGQTALRRLPTAGASTQVRGFTMPHFIRHIGIDYSGAMTADSPLTGLRVFEAATAPCGNARARPRGVAARERRLGPGLRYWTRRGLAEWLIGTLVDSPQPILVGIDHGFSFPESYFAQHGLPKEWHEFLADFCRYWPTDAPGATVEDLRRSRTAGAARRGGDARWRRLAEVRSGRAKSVFHFDVPGSVAKSTHAGLPWIRAIGEKVGWDRIHVWPFDGWTPRSGRHVLAEVYPARWNHGMRRDPRHTPDQHDAACVAAALAAADREGELEAFFNPKLSRTERAQAAYEGWILGVQP
jgi:hypothetical protein